MPESRPDAPSPPSLFHLHILKTAGTSLRYHLMEGFPAAEVFPALTPGGLTDETLARLPTSRFVAGHFARTLVEPLRPHPLVFTMLREPLAREMSQHAMFRREAEAYLVKDPFGHGIWRRYHDALTRGSCSDVLVSDVHLDHFDNMQTRFLAGGDWWSMTTPRRIDRQALDDAKHALETMVLGLCEHDTRSLLLLTDALGWPWRPLSRRLNEAKDNGSAYGFSGDVQAVRNANTLDLELYDYAKTLFEARWARFAMQAGLRQGDTEDALTAAAAAVDRRARQRPAPARLASSATLQASGDGLLSSGFQPAFFYAPLDRHVHWAPFGATLELFPSLQPGIRWTAILEAFYPAAPAALEAITATVDGEPANLAVVAPVAAQGPWRLQLSFAPQAPGFTRLALVLPALDDLGDLALGQSQAMFCGGALHLQPDDASAQASG